jgi:ankyrin repeat protein
MNNDIDLAERLLYRRADVNAFFRGKTPVMRALKYSSYDVLQLLLESPTLDINLQNQAQESALWYAVTYGTCSVLQNLLQVPKLQVDLPHRRGRTALHLAVWWGKTGLARLLHSSGGDPLTTDDFGKSPRAWAWRIGRPSMKWIFVGPQEARHSLSFYRPSAGYQLTANSELPLHQAVAHGSADAVKLLLTQKELALDAQDHNGDTPLHLAVRCRRLAVVGSLLSHPCADINCRDKDGNTPLWLSTFLSRDDMTERLLKAGGIDINFVGGRGQTQSPSTSLHHAVARSDTVALRWLPEIPGIDPNLCVAGVTPFSTAAAKGNTHAMAMLLGKGGLEINATELADPPLCRAVENGRLEAVKLLVRQGEALAINQSTVTVQDTALCLAARAGDSEMVRVLLRHPKVDPNHQNRWFEDPLLLAVKGGHLVVVEMLLQDPRMRLTSLWASLYFAEEGPIRQAIQKRVNDLRSRRSTSTASSLKWKIGGFLKNQQKTCTAGRYKLH